MAIEQEGLKYIVGVEAETKGLEKIKKYLGEDLDKLENIDKLLASIAGTYKGKLSGASRTHNADRAKELKKEALEYQKIFNLLKDPNKRVQFLDDIKKPVESKPTETLDVQHSLTGDFDPKTFKGVGEFYKSYYNPIKKQHILITKELKDNLEVIHKYVNGVEQLVPKNMAKSSKDVKKTSFDKFMSRVKNIVVYRLIRVIMSAIAQGFKQGFELLGQGNNAFKQVNTEMTAIGLKLKTSLALALLPIVQIISHALNNLSNQFIAIANAMSKANAIANDQETYFALDKQAIDDYAKSLQKANSRLTEIDKFATLSQGTPMLGKEIKIGGEEDKVNKNDLDNASNNIKAIAEVIGGVVDFFRSIIEIIVKISEFSKELKSNWEVLGTILSTVILGSIIAIGLHFKPILTIIMLVVSAVTILRNMFSNDFPPLLKGIISLLFAAATAFSVMFALSQGITKGLAAAGIAFSMAGAMILSAQGKAQALDTGSTAVAPPSIGSGIGNVSMQNAQLSDAVSTGYSQSSTPLQGDVYIDREKCGQVLAKPVYNSGVKAGFFRGKL